MYGYSAEEAQGKALEELIVPEPMRKEVVDGINDWIKFGKAIPAGEIPWRERTAPRFRSTPHTS